MAFIVLNKNNRLDLVHTLQKLCTLAVIFRETLHKRFVILLFEIKNPFSVCVLIAPGWATHALKE